MRMIAQALVVLALAHCGTAKAQSPTPPVAGITAHTFSKVHVGWGNYQLPSSASYSFATGDNYNGTTEMFWLSSKLHVGSSTTMLGQINGGFSMFEDPNAVATWTFNMSSPPPTTSSSGQYSSYAFVEGSDSTDSSRNDWKDSWKYVTVP